MKPTQVAVEVNKVAGKVNPVPRGVGYKIFNRLYVDTNYSRIAFAETHWYTVIEITINNTARLIMEDDDNSFFEKVYYNMDSEQLIGLSKLSNEEGKALIAAELRKREAIVAINDMDVFKRVDGVGILLVPTAAAIGRLQNVKSIRLLGGCQRA